MPLLAHRFQNCHQTEATSLEPGTTKQEQERQQHINRNSNINSNGNNSNLRSKINPRPNKAVQQWRGAMEPWHGAMAVSAYGMRTEAGLPSHETLL